MKTALDTELFPELCEVVHVPLHNQWVYLIQKNGSSSLRVQRALNNLMTMFNEQITDLDFIDVYIRNPRTRYISGVNTYLQHLQRDHPELDYDTAFWFARRYKFLNRHYLPQFHWLANLSQYLHKDAKIRFRNFKDFSKIVEFDSDADIVRPTPEFIKKLFESNSELDFWLFLDQILLNLAGQELTWTELMQYYKNNYPDIIKHVLPKT